ncbi:MAG: hypothetical protein H7A45_17350 [Verrucomicrobiales bacterium]|nr:hypothetical protein [Verrucomicrobiales bacterium]MCP5525582.1 hypothetical protein [Verrucomicrobiales bacterium]
MTMESGPGGMGRNTAWFIGVAGALLVVGGLAWLMVARTTPPGIDQERATLRRQTRAELQGADQQALTSAALINAEKGLYRIPIQDAMRLMQVKWEDPAAGRADLLARLEAATAKPPPAANPYE